MCKNRINLLIILVVLLFVQPFCKSPQGTVKQAVLPRRRNSIDRNDNRVVIKKSQNVRVYIFQDSSNVDTLQ